MAIRIQKNLFIKTIRQCDGNAMLIAQKLGITPRAVRKRIRSSPDLKAIADESVEALIDLAQTNVRKAIESGCVKTSRWYLERQAKHLGFGKELKVETNVETKARIVLVFPDDGREDIKPKHQANQNRS